MRIALFSGNYNYLKEGANQALNTLVRYLEEQGGCTVRVYSPVTDTPAFEPAGTLVPVPSVKLPVRGEFQLALGLPRRIREDLSRFDPQILHVSTPDILGTRAQSWAILNNIPVLASMHTHFETYLEHYGLGWARPLAQAHLDRFYRRADHVVVPTPVLAEQMKALRGDDCASVWSRGIDRNLFSSDRRDMGWRREQGLEDTDIAVLFFGRLVREKGVDLFIETLRQLQAGAPPQNRMRALVVGAGPAADEFSALSGAVLTGYLESEDLARAVASADLMLTPSTTETFGNVVLEAMASGLPVISADAPNARALLVDSETGLLCPPRDVSAYADAVMSLASDDAMRRAMGAAARAASAAYSWDAASESVLQAYRSLL